MTTLSITQLLALAGALFAIGALAQRWRWTQRRPLPVDRAPVKGSIRGGMLYAFTLGMAPWAKESTRRHGLAYIRGIAFHVGVFAGLAALLVSPFWGTFPEVIRWLGVVVIGLGAVCGLIGLIARRVEPNLKALSTPDDYAAVTLVTAFLAVTGAALLSSAWLPVMYVISTLMLVYVPLGKIRHCIYFFFSRRFFGQFIGRRAVIHTEAQQ